MKTAIKKGAYDTQQSRRKREGIYYTPGYITKYIVENTLGRYLGEIRKELGEDSLPDIEAAATVQVEGRYRKQLLQFYQGYEERLKQVKILDPACGSGAFLNQAFDFLLREYRWIHNQISKFSRGQRTVFNTDAYQRSVLQNNLYGVDLNEESAEITKLSLWLKTANSKKALPYLDDKIKCGDSLIDEPQAAGNKAFKWHEEFPEIMGNGGFDVVIGNPPYVRIMHNKDYYENNYESFPAGDLYALFIERGIYLLKKGGYFSYIVPSLFLRGMAYKPLRDFILKSGQIFEIREYGDGVFKDVKMPTSTLVIKKERAQADVVWEDLLPKAGFLNKIKETAVALENFVEIQRGLEIGRDRLLDAGRYSILTGGNLKRYFYFANKFITQETFEKFKKDERYFNGARILIRETGGRITSTFLEKTLLHTRTLYSIKIRSPQISYLYLLSILNSSLMQAYYRLKFTADTNIFPKIRIAQVRELPIKIVSEQSQRPFKEKVREILNSVEELHKKERITYEHFVRKYAAEHGQKLEKIVEGSNFLNLIYEGRARAVRALDVVVRDQIITLYHLRAGGNKQELLKFKEKDNFKRQYLKYYLENLTAERISEIEHCDGNILEKVLQIKIPDYDKPEVIRKIVYEWRQLQKEKAELKAVIEKTDKEIDRMVYGLYGLSEEEIKIVERNVT